MAAYWISPKGEIINVAQNHIATVIENPETFGLTFEGIKEVYDSYGEPIGLEGKAREEIMLNLIREGWTRIRRYANKFWSINVPRLTKKVKDNIFDWANRITDNGLFGYKEKDIFMPVKLDTSLGEVVKDMTMKDILSSALYESSEKFEESNGLKLMVLKENKMKNWVDFLLE